MEPREPSKSRYPCATDASVRRAENPAAAAGRGQPHRLCGAEHPSAFAMLAFNSMSGEFAVKVEPLATLHAVDCRGRTVDLAPASRGALLGSPPKLARIDVLVLDDFLLNPVIDVECPRSARGPRRPIRQIVDRHHDTDADENVGTKPFSIRLSPTRSATESYTTHPCSSSAAPRSAERRHSSPKANPPTTAVRRIIVFRNCSALRRRL